MPSLNIQKAISNGHLYLIDPLKLVIFHITGCFWLVVEPYPSEKYQFVSWDDEIPNVWKNNPNVPNHQSGLINCQSGRPGNTILLRKNQNAD